VRRRSRPFPTGLGLTITGSSTGHESPGFGPPLCLPLLSGGLSGCYRSRWQVRSLSMRDVRRGVDGYEVLGRGRRQEVDPRAAESRDGRAQALNRSSGRTSFPGRLAAVSSASVRRPRSSPDGFPSSHHHSRRSTSLRTCCFWRGLGSSSDMKMGLQDRGRGDVRGVSRCGCRLRDA
jgi:hypothetical protein